MKNIVIVLLLTALMIQSAVGKQKEAPEFQPMSQLYQAAGEISQVVRWRYLSNRSSEGNKEYDKGTEELYRISGDLTDWLIKYGFFESFVHESPNSEQSKFLLEWQKAKQAH